VLDVIFEDGEHLQWRFDVPIESIDDASGLLKAGQTADAASLDDATTLTAEYTSAVSVGDAWTVDLAHVSITFADGATLVASSGIVSG